MADRHRRPGRPVHRRRPAVRVLPGPEQPDLITSDPASDALELLSLEVETIHGRSARGIGNGTVTATVTTWDGRSRTLLGATAAGDELAVSLARGWRLDVMACPEGPDGLRLISRTDSLPPADNWNEADWADLIDDRLGPWSALIDGDRVVSLAHSARMTDRAAEVGVRTADDHRGRGLAPVVVAAWTAQLGDRVLFYSAFEPNAASHRVAQKCGARPLGRSCRVYVPSRSEP